MESSNLKSCILNVELENLSLKTSLYRYAATSAHFDSLFPIESNRSNPAANSKLLTDISSHFDPLRSIKFHVKNLLYHINSHGLITNYSLITCLSSLSSQPLSRHQTENNRKYRRQQQHQKHHPGASFEKQPTDKVFPNSYKVALLVAE